MTAPSELALRDWVRTRLNASIVRELATLDHGMKVDEHRRGSSLSCRRFAAVAVVDGS